MLPKLTKLQQIPRNKPIRSNPSTKQRQVRLTPDQVFDLVAAYQDGVNRKNLASRFHIHPETVTKILKREGVELRRRNNIDHRLHEASALYEQGWSLARIGEHMGVNASTVWHAFNKAGVKMRNPYEPPSNYDPG